MKTLLKITLCFVGLLVLIGGALDAAPNIRSVYAQTTEALQAQIDSLRAQIALVQTQLGIAQTTTATVPVTFRFSRTLRSGARGADVRYLQILLNRDPDTRVNAPRLLGGAGNETEYFGGATRAAVVTFQNKYAAEILRPAGLLRGTGIVAPFTRNKLNAILAALQVAAVPVVPILPPMLPASTTGTAPATPASVNPDISFDELNVKTRHALVNIICTSKRSGSFNPVSGSGVIIDPRGIILTNAHVAQYFLLKDYPVPDFIDCVIRTGEPARNRYKATLLYLSPLWVAQNARKLTEAISTGTGEHDFALLLIINTTDPTTPLPTVFPFLPLDFSNADLQEPTDVLAAAYPAGFLSGINIQKELYPSSAVVRTGQVYSFDEDTPDIFSIGASVLAQHGSSGGAVVNRAGKLIGLIVTSSGEATTGERNLNALAMTHLDKSFRKHTGDSITSLFAGDISISSRSFNENVTPDLKKLLLDALSGD